MSGEYYIVASVSGIYMYPASKAYKTKSGIIKEYKRQMEETGDRTLKVLKAQWVDADFDEYIHIRSLIKSGDIDV